MIEEMKEGMMTVSYQRKSISKKIDNVKKEPKGKMQSLK